MALRLTGPNHIHLRVNGQAADHDLGDRRHDPGQRALDGRADHHQQARRLPDHYNGAIDSVRIYNRALTDAEIDTVENTLP